MVGLPQQAKPFTRFSVVTLEGQRVLRVEAQSSYGNLVHAVHENPGQHRLSWRWRLDEPNPYANLRRKEGAESRRFSTKLGWHLPYTSRFGEVYRLSATLRGDIYHVEDVPEQFGRGEQSGLTGRLFPQLGAPIGFFL